MNKNTKGSLMEKEVVIRLMEQGLQVFEPVADGSSIDLITVSSLGQTQKLQVKSPIKSKYGFRLDLRKNKGYGGGWRYKPKQYTREEIDAFITIFENELYIFNIESVIGKNCITVTTQKR